MGRTIQDSVDEMGTRIYNALKKVICSFIMLAELRLVFFEVTEGCNCNYRDIDETIAIASANFFYIFVRCQLSFQVCYIV